MNKEGLNKASMAFTGAAFSTAAWVILFTLLISSRREQFLVPFIIVGILSAFLWSGFVSALLGALPVSGGKDKVYKVKVVNTGELEVKKDAEENENL